MVQPSYINAFKHGDIVYVWERGDDGRKIKKYKAPYYFYVEDEGGQYQSLFGKKLKKIEFDSGVHFYEERARMQRDNIQLYESDITPIQKILAEHYYQVPAPNLHCTYLDIEVDYDKTIGFSSVDNPYAPINSVALYHDWLDKTIVLTVPPKNWDGKLDSDLHSLAEIIICKNEQELLLRLLLEIDPADGLVGWNSQLFDIPYISKRVLNVLGEEHLSKMSFEHGRTPKFDQVTIYNKTQTRVTLDGRLSIDYLELFKKFEMENRPSYKLESISNELLPDMAKLEYEGTLYDLYRKDYNFFLRYNIRDVECLHGFEKKLGYIALANELYHESTGQFANILGTIKLADLSIANFCHNELDVKVPDGREPNEVGFQADSAKGAYVLKPKAGLQKWIGSVDIASLYPSAIRSINISPETLVGQFEANVDAFERIYKNDGTELSAVIQLRDGSKEVLTHDTQTWKNIFKNNNWALSGYGTIFSQEHEGVIPSVLSLWYKKRKEFKKLMYNASTKEEKEFNDRMQYCYKIKLNSLYGALLNEHFRYYDKRLGESTTGTGRAILRHMCAKVNEILAGEYDSTGKAIVYGDSVAGDSLIRTPEKNYNMEDLFTSVDNVIDTKEYHHPKNLQVLTYDESLKTTCYKPVKYIMRHKISKKMFRVWISNARYIDVTEDHSLMRYVNTRERKKNYKSVLAECKPQELCKGKSTLILPGQLYRQSPIQSKKLPKEIYELIGYIIGDGSVERKKESGVGLSLGKNDKHEVIDKLISPLKQMGWITSWIEMKNQHDIRLYGVKIWKFLRDELYTNDKKQIPNWIFNETEENISAFLRGYFTADGFVNKTKTIGLCSINSNFIKQVYELLGICGIPSNYSTETTKNSYRGKRSGTFTHRLTVLNSVKFGEKIGFLLNRKQKRIQTEYSKNKQPYKKYNFGLAPITKVEEIEFNDYVYDIEVEDTHTFFANDILVHNTDSSYFRTFADNVDDAIDISNTIEQVINATFPKFMQNTFFCTPEYKNFITAEREIVASAGIFVTPKRYILRLVDKDGKRCDELKIMGLDTKKTILPVYIREKLNGFLGRFLRGEDWDMIAREIVDYKKFLRNSSDVTLLGLPKGVNKVEHYYNLYETDENSNIPGHVRASILYNEKLKEYKDMESMPIVSSMKIKVFYLKNPIKKFKSIALPVDAERIPDWFTNTIEVDKEKQIERLIDNPLKNVLKAIDKEPPTEQSLLLDDELEF